MRPAYPALGRLDERRRYPLPELPKDSRRVPCGLGNAIEFERKRSAHPLKHPEDYQAAHTGAGPHDGLRQEVCGVQGQVWLRPRGGGVAGAGCRPFDSHRHLATWRLRLDARGLPRPDSPRYQRRKPGSCTSSSPLSGYLHGLGKAVSIAVPQCPLNPRFGEQIRTALDQGVPREEFASRWELARSHAAAPSRRAKWLRAVSMSRSV